MANVFDPVVTFHNFSKGGTVSLTVTQEVLNVMEDNSTVTLNLRYEAVDVKNNMVTYVTRDYINQQLASITIPPGGVTIT